MQRAIGIASAVFLLLSLSTWCDAEAASAGLDIIQYTAPAGWNSSDSPPSARMYAAPDADPAHQAAIILAVAASPQGPAFDLRAAFDQTVKSTLASAKLTESAPPAASRTRQGYEALSQSLAATDAAGHQLRATIVAAKVNEKLAAFCYVATDPQTFDRHKADFDSLLNSVTFAQATASAPRPQPQPNVPPPSGDLAAQKAELQRKLAELEAQEKLMKGQATAPAPPPNPMAAGEAGGRPGNVEARRKANYIVGTVVGPDGRPLKDVEYAIRVWGTTNAGEKTSFDINVNEDGTFAMPLPPGLYKITPCVKVSFQGRRISLDLHPLDGKPANYQYVSIEGIVRDYQLRLSGLKPGADPHSIYSFYGGRVSTEDSNTDLFTNLAARYPKGSKVRITLTPQTPLLDGSRGQVITLECPVEQTSSSAGWGNIPIAVYRATAVLITPDGRNQPLLVSDQMGGQFGPSVDLSYEPAGIGGDLLSDPYVYVKG